MDQELKAKWVADLRAHPELQGKQYLRSVKNEYCCLGRLREVAGFDWLLPDVGADYYYTPDYYYTSLNFSSCSLEINELKKTGLSISIEQILIDMNDGGKTFAEIADWIEANL